MGRARDYVGDKVSPRHGGDEFVAVWLLAVLGGGGRAIIVMTAQPASLREGIPPGKTGRRRLFLALPG